MKGFLFTPEMAVAAMREDGPKTVTRRVMSPQPVLACATGGNTPMWRIPRGPVEYYFWSGSMAADVVAQECDYKAGERRCLLTTWAVCAALDGHKPTEIWTDEGDVLEMREGFWHAGLGTPKPDWCGKSRPGRFLPNHLRPLMPVFEVVSARAERVQDITEADAQAEGIGKSWPNYAYKPRIHGAHKFTSFDSARGSFASLWDSINAARGFGWAVNPWCWRVEFRRVTP